LRKIEESRSPRSQVMDERQTNAKVVSTNSPLTERWAAHPGRMDVQSIDAPRIAKVTLKFKRPKIKTGNAKRKHRGRNLGAGIVETRTRGGRKRHLKLT